MPTAVQPYPNSGLYYIVENGYKFDFPKPLALELKEFLVSQGKNRSNVCIGEWVLSLPTDERLTIGITFLSKTVEKNALQLIS